MLTSEIKLVYQLLAKSDIKELKYIKSVTNVKPAIICYAEPNKFFNTKKI